MQKTERARAKNPVISRRTVVACMSLTPAATASAAIAPQENSEILALFRQHQSYQEWMNDLPLSWSEEDLEPHYQHLSAIARQMMALPAKSAADFAAKAIVDTFNGGLMPCWKSSEFWKEARNLTNTII